MLASLLEELIRDTEFQLLSLPYRFLLMSWGRQEKKINKGLMLGPHVWASGRSAYAVAIRGVKHRWKIFVSHSASLSLSLPINETHLKT